MSSRRLLRQPSSVSDVIQQRETNDARALMHASMNGDALLAPKSSPLTVSFPSPSPGSSPSPLSYSTPVAQGGSRWPITAVSAAMSLRMRAAESGASSGHAVAGQPTFGSLYRSRSAAYDSPSVIQSLREEHREASLASRAMLIDTRAPSLTQRGAHSKARGGHDERDVLARVLTEAAAVRQSAEVATEEVRLEYEVHFKTHTAGRQAASLLVKKSAEISHRLQASSRAVEAAAAASLSVSLAGATEKEANIFALREEVRRLESELLIDHAEHRRRWDAERLAELHHEQAMAEALVTELRVVETERAEQEEVMKAWRRRMDDIDEAAALTHRERAEIDSLRRQLGSLERARETAKQSKDALLATLEEERAGRKADKAAARAQIEEALLERDGLAQKMADYEEGSEEAASRLRKAELDGHSLKKLCDSAVNKLNSFEAEMAATVRQLDEAKKLLHANGLMLEEEREKKIRHLQYVGVMRIMKASLAKGFTTWHARVAERKAQLQKAMGRWKHKELNGCFRKWVRACPPAAQMRELMEPLEARLAELESALSRERAASAEAAERLARTEQSLSLSGRNLEHERESRVRHLTEVAIRRIMQGALARGWGSWHGLYKHRKELARKSLARLRNMPVYSSFSRWARTCRRAPVEMVEASVMALLERRLAENAAALRNEREAHAMTQMRGEAHAEKETAMLRALVRELQNVLGNAMKATSWTKCREVLYHESCRYVPEAATHGKLMTDKMRKSHSVSGGGLLTARLTTGGDIERLVATSSPKRDREVLHNSPPHHRPAPPMSPDRIKSPPRYQSTPARLGDIKSSAPPSPRPVVTVRGSGGGGSQQVASGGASAGGSGGPRIQVQHSLHALKLDPADASKPLDAQLKEMLTKNAVRVVDLFREWDVDGHGYVSKRDFRRAILQLGSEAPREVVDALFDAIDEDFNGKIEYHELNKLLRRGGSMHINESLLPGGGSSGYPGIHFAMDGKSPRHQTARTKPTAAERAYGLGVVDTADDLMPAPRMKRKQKTGASLAASKAYGILGSLG